MTLGAENGSSSINWKFPKRIEEDGILVFKSIGWLCWRHNITKIECSLTVATLSANSAQMPTFRNSYPPCDEYVVEAISGSRYQRCTESFNSGGLQQRRWAFHRGKAFILQITLEWERTHTRSCLLNAEDSYVQPNRFSQYAKNFKFSQKFKPS